MSDFGFSRSQSDRSTLSGWASIHEQTTLLLVQHADLNQDRGHIFVLSHCLPEAFRQKVPAEVQQGFQRPAKVGLGGGRIARVGLEGGTRVQRECPQ
jgi:hypothetical protein